MLIVSETALGRMTGKSPVGAFAAFGKGKFFRAGGWINAVVPMMIMLSVWCVIRIIYIMLVVHFIGEIGYIYWAYPLTWAISSTIYLIYYLRSDWVHGFER